MKLKGEIDSVGLAELFKTLADQNACGILSVFSTMGEKHISIQQGTLSIISDRLCERARLGDLLIARGFLTDAQLAEALKIQRQGEQRTRLGDLLVKNNILSEDKIQEAMRFQLEEEIYDIFTWKSATFEFDSDKGVDDVAQHAIGHEDLHHLTIDARALITEASRRMAEWQELQQRLPTPYLCFKMSPKGDELSARATRSIQTIITLLKEGRTLETTVKRSCQSRFNVCKSVVKLLDDGWIHPYPTSELPALANEHRAKKRFADALNIYRRLLDSSDVDSDRQHLQQAINDTIEAILQAREADSGLSSLEIVSHKKAAEQYLRRKRIRKVVMAAFCIIAVCIIGVLLLLQYSPKPVIPQDYTVARKAAEVAADAGKHEEAMDILTKFYDSLSDKESDTAKRVQERLKLIPPQFESYVARLLNPFEVLEKDGKLNEAQTGYTQLLERFPRSTLISRIKEGLVRIQNLKEIRLREEALAALANTLAQAEEHLSKKQYLSARSKFQEASTDILLNATQRTALETRLVELNLLEGKTKQSLANGFEELKLNHAEKAIELWAHALKEWPDAPELVKAKEEYTRLKLRMDEMIQFLKQADVAETQRDLLTTLEILKKIENGYPEFELTATLKPRITQTTNQVTIIEAQLQEAKTLLSSGNVVGAREKFSTLLRRQPGFLSARKAEVPVSIHSRPPALLKIDGRDIGLTPQEIMLPVSRMMLLSFELKGYQTHQRRVGPLQANDLEINALLRPDPLRILKLRTGIFAPPVVLAETLYIFNGSTLSAFAASGDKQLWEVDALFNENALSRPNSSGSGQDEGIPDKNWWFPRTVPLGLDVSGSNASADADIKGLLLALRSRDCVELKDLGQPNPQKPKVTKLLTTPVEPVGQPIFERNSKLAGKSLLVVGCADGKIRGYDLDKPEIPLWEQSADPATPAPKGTVVSGLAPRPSSQCVSLSASGRLACFNLFDGKPQWALELKAPVSANTALPNSAQENVAAILMLNGAVTLVDLVQHERLWDLPVQHAMDEALYSAVGSNGIYLVTTEGIVKKFSRENTRGIPAPLWKHPLDGAPQSNLVLGPKALYVATSEGTVYALHPDDGHELWNFKPPHKIKTIGTYKDLLYLASEDGHVIIMNAE